jgi:vitamin B12 transporter
MLFLCLFQNKLFSQTKDTALLPEVDITAFKSIQSKVGKRTHLFDSAALTNFAHQHLGDLLSSNTGIFVKQYGPGALNTTSIRGGNAAQTAILWNGINLQNSMLGQTDLSLIPVMMFNSAEIEYGGGSSVWGSGAIGGAVHLNNTLRFNKGLQTDLRLQGSGIGNQSLGSNICYSNQKMALSLKAFGLNAANQFAYIHPLSGNKHIQQQANFYQYSIMPEIKYLIHPKHSINAAAWINKGKRHFPPLFNKQHNNIFQSDESNRILIQWQYFHKKFQSNFKSAYIQEQLLYSDSVAKIKSISNMQSILAEQENHLQWLGNQQLSAGLHFSYNGAKSNNYQNSRSISRTALYLANTGRYFNDRFTMNTSIRWEHTNLSVNPFTYHIALSYIPLKGLELKLNGGKVYRLPTLNDLYWYPGGNVNLKPEQGYTADGSVDYTIKSGAYHVYLTGAAFNRQIQNWILWLPGTNGNPTPMNVQEVWSRGTETSVKIVHRGKYITSSLSFQSSYILSTVGKNNLENHNTQNKQLIYTPRYTYNSIAGIAYKNLSMQVYHNYVGYRFTSSDNSTWLDPYQVMSFRLQYAYRLNNTSLQTFVNIHNLSNVNYSIMQNRPMPLRYAELGLQIQFIKNTKTTQP